MRTGSKGRLLLAMGLLVSYAGMAADADKSKLITFKAQAKVTVDAAGKPTQVEASGDLPDAVRTYIERRVATWSFAPPQRGGQIGDGVTYVHLGACAIPTKDGYSLAIDYKNNGPGMVSVPIPYYPPAAARAGVETTMNVTYVVEPNGRATFEKAKFTGPKMRDFELLAKEWVKAMRYKPEEFDGQPVRTRITTPVDFKLGNVSKKELAKESPENQPECKAATEPDLRPVAQDSPFKLISQGG